MLVYMTQCVLPEDIPLEAGGEYFLPTYFRAGFTTKKNALSSSLHGFYTLYLHLPLLSSSSGSSLMLTKGLIPDYGEYCVTASSKTYKI